MFISDVGNYRIRKVGPDGIIRTVAGNGNRGHSGDGGAATGAQLNPRGLSVDMYGNIYFSDKSFIRKVSPDGIIMTVAGNGNCCTFADNIIAINAQF